MDLNYKVRGAHLLSTAATTLALLLAPVSFAAAQEAQSEPAAEETNEADDVVVTGIRAALRSAIQTKKASDSIVESITNEDIGKLPDASVAESISRLPGLVTQRSNGRAQTIAVRGLPGDFSIATLNGREQVSTGDNRSVEFDQYPSELVGRVDVYKTPNATMTAQGVSATIDLRTIRPLEYGRRAINAGARYEWNELGALNAGTEETGYRLNGSYIDQFADGTIGVALGIAHMFQPSQNERWEAWGYPNAGPGGAFVIGGAKPYVLSSELERTGVTGTIEFKPNANFRTIVDGYYSTFEDIQTLRGIEFPLAWSSAQLDPGATVTNGLVTQGTFTGVKPVVRNDANTFDANLFSLGWNTQFGLGDWNAETDVSFSQIDRQSRVLETYSGTSRGGGNGPFDTLGFSSRGEEGFVFNPTLNYADYNLIQLTGPQGWGGLPLTPNGQDGFDKRPDVDDQITALKGSLDRDVNWGFIDNFEFGGTWTKREKDYRTEEFFLQVAANFTAPGQNISVPIPVSARLAPTRLGFLGIPGMVSYDPVALVNSGIYRVIPFGQALPDNPDVTRKSWTVAETVSIAYVMGNINAEAFGSEVTGNVGLQIVQTKQESTGFVQIGTTSNQVTREQDYTEALPSLNLVFRMPNDHVIRFGAARTLSRPRMDDLRASFGGGIDPILNVPAVIAAGGSPWSGGGGNPFLKPIIANSYDVAYEAYLSNDSYVAVGLYRKDLDSWVRNRNVLYDFTGFPTNGLTPLTFRGVVSVPDNTEGGYIQGLELSGVIQGDLIAPVLDGFGVSFSGAWTESEILDPSTNRPTTIPNQSEFSSNLTAFYEKAGFQTRVSWRHRDEFLAELPAFDNTRRFLNARAEDVVDGQIGYEFQSGPAKGLSFVLQGYNLTNEAFGTFEADPRLVTFNENYGAKYLFGINYKR